MSPVNDIVSPDPENIYKLRDFAADTLTKNGPAANLTDQESIFESRDFAAETLKKNGDDAIVFNPEPFEDILATCDLRDFTAKTFLKNGVDDNLGGLADSHPKNGHFSIVGFFSFFHNKKGNFRIFLTRRFFDRLPYFYNYSRFDKLMSRVCPAEIKLRGSRGHRFLMTLKNKIFTA